MMPSPKVKPEPHIIVSYAGRDRLVLSYPGSDRWAFSSAVRLVRIPEGAWARLLDDPTIARRVKLGELVPHR